jgi:hypothetical protein
MEYLKIIKTAMHEMIGVPETALGQVQPISNTSGVALSIQYQPLMNRYHQKLVQYEEGLQRINELVLLTLAFKEPGLFVYNPRALQREFVQPNSRMVDKRRQRLKLSRN